jgi:hypothetical protein
MTASLQARLCQATHSARIALFGWWPEGDMGARGSAVNERGDLVDWWLYPDDWLEVSWLQTDQLAEWELPAYFAARAEAQAAMTSSEENRHPLG